MLKKENFKTKKYYIQLKFIFAHKNENGVGENERNVN